MMTKNRKSRITSCVINTCSGKEEDVTTTQNNLNDLDINCKEAEKIIN
jgi:nitrate reductase NapAB chaperone NapD